MASYKKISSTLKSNADTGFGTTPDTQGGRFINKDGSFNVVKRGISFHERISPYYKLLMMPAWEFTVALLIFFVAVNVFFTAIYVLINPNEFTGIIGENFA